MKPCVFIHTNQKQYLGALVSMHSMRRNSRHADEFDVKLIEYETYQDFFAKYEGRTLQPRRRQPASGTRRTCSRSRRCASCRPS